MSSNRRRALAAVALLGALAAIALPTEAKTAEIASILAIGALALLAGHDWGVPVVVLADVALLERLWPLVVYEWPPAPEVQLVTYAALASALPGLGLLRATLPGTVELICGRACSPRLRTTAVAAGSLLSVAWLLVPTWQML
ncbi:hypothetical protein [Haliangium sp.]|uniref:hypothetical protein n=1 Tax=Haliangium sp. TaxID=2663208 RepID=UPI003D0C2016